MVDLLKELMAQQWFWPAAIGIAAILFRNNPAIKPFMDILLSIFAPKKQVTPPPVAIENDPLTAIQHYVALAECCKNCKPATEKLKEVWSHLDPTVKAA